VPETFADLDCFVDEEGLRLASRGHGVEEKPVAVGIRSLDAKTGIGQQDS